MDRQAFQKSLHQALRDPLLTSVHQHIDDQYEVVRQVIRYITALDRKYEEGVAITEGLPGILGAMERAIEQGDTELDSLYIARVREVAQSFPSQTTWQQKEERFTVIEDDSLATALVKHLKRGSRSVARGWHQGLAKVASLFGVQREEWRPWRQTIPLENVVTYHLLDADCVVSWLHQSQRIHLDLIEGMEELLVSELEEGDTIHPSADLAELAKQLQHKTAERLNSLKEGVRSDIEQMEAGILEQVEKVGTFECRSRFYRENRIASRYQKVEKQLKDNLGKWKTSLQQLHERIRLMFEFVNLRTDILGLCSGFLSELEDYLAGIMNGPLDQLCNMLQQEQDPLTSAEIAGLKKELENHLETQLLDPLKRSLENEVFLQKMEHFYERLVERANQTSQSSLLLYEVELVRNPPKIEQHSMEWRLLVVRSIREKIVNAVQPSRQQFQDFLSTTVEKIREIDNIIEVNLESALAVQKNKEGGREEEATEIAGEALERVLITVENLQDEQKEQWRKLEQGVREGGQAFNRLLLSLVYEGSLKELQLMNARYRARKTTKGWKTILGSSLARIQDTLAVWSRFGVKKIRHGYSRVGQFLGFKKEELAETKRADIATYLSETDQKMRELPHIYRKLFNFDAVADQRFYVPVADAAATFRRAHEQWKNSFAATFAVVGEKGSGKSSFLNLMLGAEVNAEQLIQIQFRKSISSEQMLVAMLSEKLEVPEAVTVQDIVDAVKEWPENKVVAIEGIQNCFVRNINGYEAIEKLCYLISETGQHLFWVVSCSRYAWRFLDKTVQLSEYFSHLTTCDDLDPEQIKKVIMSRHRASGYTLHFVAEGEAVKSRSYRKLMDQEEEAQEYLKNTYFKKLTELAEGNASVAMIFWIRSIREFDETCCYIQPLEVTSLEMIQNLSLDVLFTLAAFVLHDTLNGEELSMVLNVNEEESRLMLNRLQARGLLEHQGDTYTINHLMYRQIVRVLKDRNIIHLV